MEGDFVLFEVHHITCYFNPLPPYGGRRLIRYPFSRIHAFQSTPSVWRETFSGTKTGLERRISIHSLRMEGDRASRTLMGISQYFNSLPPYGGRRVAQ